MATTYGFISKAEIQLDPYFKTLYLLSLGFANDASNPDVLKDAQLWMHLRDDCTLFYNLRTDLAILIVYELNPTDIAGMKKILNIIGFNPSFIGTSRKGHSSLKGDFAIENRVISARMNEYLNSTNL